MTTFKKTRTGKLIMHWKINYAPVFPTARNSSPPIVTMVTAMPIE
jgi:hypothetical protein